MKELEPRAPQECAMETTGNEPAAHQCYQIINSVVS